MRMTGSAVIICVTLIAVSVMLSSCSSGSTRAATTPSTSSAQVSSACAGIAGHGVTVGFTSLDNALPFSVLVQDGVQRVAAECGVNLLTANNASSDRTALTNAQSFVARGAKAVLWFNYDASIASEVCRIFKGLPVITISVPLPPCGLLIGDNNRSAGILGGKGVGQYVKSHWNCKVDKIVTFENFNAGVTNSDRMNGQIQGLQSICPRLSYGTFETWAPTVPNSIITRENAFRLNTAYQTFRNYLTANPAASHIVVLCINGPACEGALSAAKNVGRTQDVALASQSGSIATRPLIRQYSNYVGTVDYFPQCYGEALVPDILQMLHGKKPTRTVLPFVFIDAHNISQYYPIGAQPAKCPISNF